MVNIYVREEDSDDQWIRGLEIPLEDIQRLSLRPLKWLRFVALAVLGAKDDLPDAPEGNIVDYDTVSVADAESYYFFHDGRYHLVDSDGLADRITSSAPTPRRPTFLHDVAERHNNRCVITQSPGDGCHTAHIIPHSKGDEYIRLIISKRRSLYEDQQVDLRSDLDIDSTENGMLLTPDLHNRCGRGLSAFLKTPNFALDPDDIPRVEPGEIPTSRTTIQHIEPWLRLDPVLQRDVRADWGVQGAPPSILLDYMYGVAVIQRWAAEDIKGLLKECHEAYYNTPSSIPKDDDDDGPEDPTDADYVFPGTVQHSEARQTRTEAAHCRAIDTAFAFSMFIKGYPPGTTTDRILQKQEEEAEMCSRQVAREKVQGWLNTSETLPISHTDVEHRACDHPMHSRLPHLVPSSGNNVREGAAADVSSNEGTADE